MYESPVTESIDRIADRFEAAWKVSGAPAIEAFLYGCPALERNALILELQKIDAEYRHKAGLPFDLQSRLDQFPELKKEGWLVDDLSSFIARLPSGESPTAVATSSTVDGATAPSAPGLEINAETLKRIGRFEIMGELGRGGFAVVFRAKDPHLMRDVAVKVLQDGFLATRQQRELFAREARSVGQLQHEGIVPIYEFGEAQGYLYLVSKLIGGRSLALEIRERKKFEPRQAAALAEGVARALNFAHQNGVVHRDVKPQNILLDEEGMPHLIDFGMAKWTVEQGTFTISKEPFGTLAYMSPEQSLAKPQEVGQLSDVYSLGVVLYELLTGVQPFQGEPAMIVRQIQDEEPRPPSRYDHRIPSHLEWICLKAMEKAPSRRYATAGEFADDLQRFQNGEVPRARPVSVIERGYRYCRRRWRIVVPTALAILGLLASSVIYGYSAQVQAQDRARELMLEHIQRLRLRERANGWSNVAAESVRKAAGIRGDDDLRDYAAATREGLDARIIKQFPGLSASSVAFDSDGDRILLGAGSETAKLYDVATEHAANVGLTGPGPVTFTPDGRPLQLTFVAPDRLELHDLQNAMILQSFALPRIAERPSDVARLHPVPIVVLAPDGTRVGAAFRLANDRGMVIVWDAATGREIARWDYTATALAFSPDGSLVAAGSDDGRINVWSPDTKALTAELHGPRVEISCLAIHPNPRGALANEADDHWERRWLLAAGDHGGTVTIWDLAAATPVAFCRGAHHRVSTVTFSPDGTLVAGGAHAEVRAWDVATGAPLLKLTAQPPSFLQDVSGIAFSPDGRLIAISSLEKFSPAVVVIAELQHGRGIRTLRGLTGEVAKIRFAPNDRRIAAFSHRWEIGVWNTEDGRLLRIFDAPRGYFADNFGLALSRDGERLAACSGTEARLWEVDTGRLLASWKVPPGLQDELTFTPDGQFMLLRFETKDGELPPMNIAPPDAHSRVCRVRLLKTDGTIEQLAEFDDFNWHVRQLLLAPDGRYFVGAGSRMPSGGARQPEVITRALSIPGGERLWEKDFEGYGDSRTGPLAAVPGDREGWQLFDLPAPKLIGWVPPNATLVGAGRRLNCGGSRRLGNDETESGRNVYRFGEASPIVTLGIDRPIAAAWPQFSLDETFVAWGHTDGTVQLADLRSIQSWLAGFGLGW